ncbi:hypothetical protein KC963_00675 [Candidatus Saccharibacteria bacterium]|nr:hypothetical protein [Candidatus Saccharibacteria bacterium]
MSKTIQTVESKPAAPVYNVTPDQLKIITRVASAEVAVFGKVKNIHRDLVSLFDGAKSVAESETVAKRLLFDTLGQLQAREGKVTPTHKVIVNLNNHVRLAFGSIAKAKADHPALPKCPKTKQATAFALKKPKGEDEWRVKPVEKKPQSPRTPKKEEGPEFKGNPHEIQAQRAALVGVLLTDMAAMIQGANDPETRTMLADTASNGIAQFRDLFRKILDKRVLSGETIEGTVVTEPK